MKPAWRAWAGPHLDSGAKGYLRFSFANSVENLQRALERIESWAKKNRI